MLSQEYHAKAYQESYPHRIQKRYRFGKFLFIVLSLALLPGLAMANYKRDYCGGNEFIGGDYPHLHCGKNFFTLSRSRSDHINFNGRHNCKKVQEVLSDPGREYNNKQAITTILEAYQRAGCP